MKSARNWKNKEIKHLIYICEYKMNYSDAARTFGISEDAVRSAYRRHVGSSLRKIKRTTSEDVKLIKSLRESGMTWDKVAEQVGISPSGVRSRLYRYQKMNDAA